MLLSGDSVSSLESSGFDACGEGKWSFREVGEKTKFQGGIMSCGGFGSTGRKTVFRRLWMSRGVMLL
jgi:hypothetical protein